MAFDSLGDTVLARTTVTRAELIARIVEKYQAETHTNRYRPLLGLEDVTEEELGRTSVIGTILEPAVIALAEAGVPTTDTIGDLMDAPLSLTEDDVHHVSCSCRGSVTPDLAAARFEGLLT